MKLCINLKPIISSNPGRTPFALIAKIPGRTGCNRRSCKVLHLSNWPGIGRSLLYVKCIKQNSTAANKVRINALLPMEDFWTNDLSAQLGCDTKQ